MHQPQLQQQPMASKTSTTMMPRSRYRCDPANLKTSTTMMPRSRKRCDPRSLFVVIPQVCVQQPAVQRHRRSRSFVKFLYANFYILIPRLPTNASMPERSKGLDSSSSIFGFASSNLVGCSFFLLLFPWAVSRTIIIV